MPYAAAHATIKFEGLCPLLQVFDMSASLAFYRDLLGFEMVASAPAGASVERIDWAWLRHGDAELMLNTAYDPHDVRPPAPDRARVAAHDDTGLFIGCPDIDAMYAHLRERGFDVRPPKVTHYGMRQLFVKDPDGFGVCFQWNADNAAQTSEESGLTMHDACLTCGAALGEDAAAMICSFECTFCPACATATQNVCPNCHGELVPRPRRTLSGD